MTGKQGEDTAAAYLVSMGYAIMERNYRANRREIDIIASYCGLIVFVEVKARENDRYSAACEAVTIRKQERIISAASVWFQVNAPDAYARFDVIEVYRDRINHIERAFDLPPG